MKIINRKDFLKLPANTLYQDYRPCIFGSLSIKGDSIGEIDFWQANLESCIDCFDTGDMVDTLNNAEKTGESIKLDIGIESREAMFDDKQLYAVWEKHDVLALIDALNQCAGIKP